MKPHMRSHTNMLVQVEHNYVENEFLQSTVLHYCDTNKLIWHKFPYIIGIPEKHYGEKLKQ